MKTDDLIDLLAQDPLLKTPRLSPAELYLRLLLGVGTSVLVLLAWHGLHPRLILIISSEPFIAKMLWLSALALGSGVLVWRWAIPGLHAGRAHWLILLGYAFLLALALQQWWQEGGNAGFWNGSGSGWMCVSSLLVLGLPILAGVQWALTRLAPTSWLQSGMVAGLLSGSLAAQVYSLRCGETSYGFFLLWYGLGIFLVTIVSVLVSRRQLRW